MANYFGKINTGICHLSITITIFSLYEARKWFLRSPNCMLPIFSAILWPIWSHGPEDTILLRKKVSAIPHGWKDSHANSKHVKDIIFLSSELWTPILWFVTEKRIQFTEYYFGMPKKTGLTLIHFAFSNLTIIWALRSNEFLWKICGQIRTDVIHLYGFSLNKCYSF